VDSSHNTLKTTADDLLNALDGRPRCPSCIKLAPRAIIRLMSFTVSVLARTDAMCACCFVNGGCFPRFNGDCFPCF
jgi:hypothetical protein